MTSDAPVPLAAPCDLSGVVVERREVARDAFVLRFAPRAPAPPFAPGQFLELAGWTGHDPLLPRPFSLLDQAPGGAAGAGSAGEGHGRDLAQRAQRATEGGWLSVLCQASGQGTRLLARLEPGARVDAFGPLGRPFLVPEREGEVLVVAGGVGIPPFLLVVRELRARGRSATVLLGARDAEHLYLREELKQEGASVRVATEDGSAGLRGRVTALLEEELDARGPDRVAAVLTCGPEPMLKAVAAVARRRGVPGQASLERLMACGFGVCFTCVCRLRGQDGKVRNRRICLEGPVVPLSALPDDDAW